MGKLLDERMSALGATRFYDAGFADDAVGLIYLYSSVCCIPLICLSTREVYIC